MSNPLPEAADALVTYACERGVAMITLNRPPLNTYDRELHAELAAAWRRAAADDEARVILLCAEGSHFCAGAEIGAVPPPGDERRGLSTAPGELSFARNIMKPTIAAVQGGCIGGGQRFAFACDLIFCSDDAFFSDPLVKMGIGGIQPPIHAWLYGPRLAKEMLFSGMRLPAERLYASGAVNRLYSRDRLLPETIAFAREIATYPPVALRQAKRAVNTTMDILGQHYIENRFAELLDETPTLRWEQSKDGPVG